MNTKKITPLLIAAFALLVAAVSCGKEEPAIVPELSVAPATISATAKAGSYTITVTSNVSWTASENAAWLTLSPASGKNNGTITLNATENTAVESRTATVTVTAGSLSKTVTVTQAGSAPALSIDPVAVSATAEAANYTLNVTGNTAWTASENAEWLTLSPASGNGNGTITLSVAANTTIDSRTTAVTVTAGSITQTVTVTQAGSAPALAVESTAVSATAAAGSYTVAVTGNVAWTATENAAWLTLTPASGNGNGTITLTVTENTATDARTAAVTVTAGSITHTVTVTQAGVAATLTVDPATADVMAVAETYHITVTSNVAWTATDNAEWITLSPASGNGNATIVMSVAANTAASQRTATVTITAGSITRTVPVTQAAATAALAIEPASIAATVQAADYTLTVTGNVSWTATDNADWLTLSPASGNGNATIVMSVAANTAASQRTGTVTVTDGSITRSVTVTQAGSAPALAVTPTAVSATAEAADYTVNVTGNVSWTATDNADWLILSPASGNGNGTITLKVAVNTIADVRTATVTVTAGSLTQTVTVTQAGAAPTLSIDPATMDVSANQANYTVNVTCNTAWTAVSNDDWLTPATYSGYGGIRYLIFVAANFTEAPRTGTITFTAGSVTKTMTFTQAGAVPALSLSRTTLHNESTQATAFLLDVTCNVSWTAVSNDDWITLDSPASGSGNFKNWRLSGAAAVAEAPRTGTVTFTAGALTETVTVTQVGITLAITPATLSNVYSDGSEYDLKVAGNAAWKATSGADWITPAVAYGNGYGGLHIVVANNTTGSPRASTVTFTAGEVVRTVPVSQNASAQVLVLDPTAVSATDLAADYTVNVTGNVSWTATSNVGWITIGAPASGNGNGAITLSVAENTARERTGTVTVAAGSLTQTVTVTQRVGSTYTPTPFAATPQTWTVGNQIWTDVIQLPECNKEDFGNSAIVPHCRAYYYNWPYVNEHAATLCPSPWRVPTKDDFVELDIAMGGPGESRLYEPREWIINTYINTWGGSFGGYAQSSNVNAVGIDGSYWSSDASGARLRFSTLNQVEVGSFSPKGYGYPVRCVRNTP